MLYYLSWAGAFFTGWVIPWWFWAAAGVAGGAAIFLLLPAIVPSTLRRVLAELAVIAGVGISLYSMGMSKGISLENERWERQMAAEKRRLEEGFKEQLGAERLRATEAETAKASLEEQLREIDRDADAAQDAGDIVVPEYIARGLWSLRPAYTKRDRR